MTYLSSAASNPIAAIELVAVWVALLLWGPKMAHRAVLAFVDNDPAKHALVRGGSGVAEIASIVDAICTLEIDRRAMLYYERVPSSSNIADPPSRGVRPGALEHFDSPLFCSCVLAGGPGQKGQSVVLGLRDLLFVVPCGPIPPQNRTQQ